MKLTLTRPLAAFDIESTSAKPQTARIIELAIIKIYPDGNRDQLILLFNPGEAIPAEASAIHGFTDEMVKDKPLFKQLATEVSDFIKGCDLLTFNGNSFDIPLLNEEFNRAGVALDLTDVNFIDAGNLFKIFAPRTLAAAHKTYVGTELEGAHGAKADTEATINVFESMLDVHSDEMPLTVPELALKSNFDRKRLDLDGKFTYNEKGEVVYNFGPHKGKDVQSEAGFAKWMLSKKEVDGSYSFSEDTREIAESLTNGGRPLSDGKRNRVYIDGVHPKFAPNSSRPQTGKY